MPLSEEQRRQAVSDAKLGNFMSLSGSSRVRELGKIMNKSGQGRIDEGDKYRAPVSLGRGILVNADGSVTNNEAYEKSLTDEHKRGLEAQAAKDAEAFKREEIKGRRTANQMPAGERKLYRISGTAMDALQKATNAVDQNQDAFGQMASYAEYLPDWTPNVARQWTKNFGQRQFNDKQQQARQAVYEQAYAAINSLAGAALSEHEANRLEQFLPSPQDDARTVLNKLRGAYQTAQRMNQSFSDVYGVSAYQTPNVAPEATQEASEANQPPPLLAKQPEPVGQPRPLSDGTVWQKYSDGSTQQVQ